MYIEYALPETPEENQIFTLNQHGVIVDAYAGGGLASGVSIECPEKIFTEGELAEILKKERARRTDLPPELPEFRTRVQRIRCLYFYFEYALPEVRGKYQVFTIDPFGELLEFSRSQPY